MAAQIVTLIGSEFQGGWRSRSAWRTNWRGAIRRGIYTLVLVWLAAFAMSVMTTIYDDHVSLSGRLRAVVNEKEHLKAELQKRDALTAPQLPQRNLQVVRQIQSALSDFATEGSKIRDDWKAFMAQHANQHLPQRTYASRARDWHVKVGNYLRTIPRGNTYVARLNAAPKTGAGGWPLGIDYTVSETFDLLSSDLTILNEFQRDTELGEP